MLSDPGIADGRRLHRQDGFTLVELLVVIVTATVIAGALFTILDVTLRSTTRTFTRVDATQRARTQIEALENELHSACVAANVAPIQAGSTGTTLNFLSYYGDAASPTPVWHSVVFSGGTLTDNAYSVSGTAPSWTQGTLQSSYQLLNNVAQIGTTPPFQYFAYQEAPNGSGGYYTDGAGNPYMMLLDGTSSVSGTNTFPAASPLATPLSAANAALAAEVLINLSVGPTGGSQENTNLSDANVSVTDSVILRLTPVANHVETGANFQPCR
jgi:prepilin-type N-terminal cleavage/methylation domain-containing protein